MKIKRWGVYSVNLEPNIGTKPGKIRPAVVIQNNLVNAAGHPSTVILPLSSKTKNKNQFPLRVYLPKGEADLDKDSVVLVDQVLAWDNRRFVRHIGQLSSQKSDEIRCAFLDFFAFDED